MSEISGSVHYYYLREMHENDKQAPKGHPFGVIAVKNNGDGTVNRGIAICSPTDYFDKRKGRGLALQRLLKAEREQKSSEAFSCYTGNKDKMNFDTSKVDAFQYKCGYREAETKQEHRMFYKPF
ncbi:MAG: hypothetical protein IKP65_07610 [Alphaproteobacteria bacterium]|nr:hypothetical protein [Alphaproteobacteria bacterium]